MGNLNDLIREIRDDEALELNGSLDFAKQWRIEEKIQNAIKDESNVISYKKRTPKKWFLFGIAAVLVFALGLTSVAAVEQEWDIVLTEFMGISDANTLQLESGEVQIEQSSTSSCVDYGTTTNGETKDVTMRAVSSIGDKNEVYIRIETDYELPEYFDSETDYILPGDSQITVDPMRNGFGSVFTTFAQDNRLGFLLGISNCKKINKSTVSIAIEDLYLYHDLGVADSDEEPVLLCSGNWELEWTYNYKSNTQTHRMLRKVQSRDVTYYLTKVEVSPISIRLEAFRMPWDRHKRDAGKWVSEIQFQDGTTLSINEWSSSGLRNGMFADYYIGIDMLHNAIQPDAVDSITFNGTPIKLH